MLIDWLKVLANTPLIRRYVSEDTIEVSALDYPDGADIDAWVDLLRYLAPDGFAVVRAACFYDDGSAMWVGRWVRKEE